MPFAATHTIGAVLDGVQPNDGGKGFALGNTLLGNDGRRYVLVQASASISAATPGTEVTITEPAMTAATGAGGYRAPDATALASGDRFWARQKDL